MLRTLFLVLLLLTLPLWSGCVGTSRELRGTQVGDQVWQGQIRIVGDVELPEGTSLVIRPGTEVLFAPPGKEDRFRDHPHFPGSELIVRGTLYAEGTAREPITFRFVDATAPAGSWGGINLTGSPAALFRFCRFTQADSAIHSQQSEVQIRNSLFEENRVGIRFHDSAMLIEGNLLQRNGAAIRFHYGAPLIRHNRIVNNDKGLFITSHPRDYRIEENDLSGNREASVVLGEEVEADVDLARNWWGTLDPDVIEAGFFDGRRVDYLGQVRYAPSLTGPPPLLPEVPWNR